MNLQTSFMTPPFGATLFYMKGTVPPGVTMGDIYRGMKPFVALQIIGVVLCVASRQTRTLAAAGGGTARLAILPARRCHGKVDGVGRCGVGHGHAAHLLRPPSVPIAPGSPWENGYCESFTGKLKDECLRQEIFYSLKEAQTVIGIWQNTYNRVRPHWSLGYRPPAPVTFLDLAFRLPMASVMQ